MNARLLRSASLLLTLAISGCSLSIGGQLDELDVEPGTPSIARPAVACLPEAGVAVGGARPAGSRIIAIIRTAGTPASEPGVEVELAPFGADVTWSGTLRIADEGEYGVAVVAENGAGTRSLQSSTITIRVDRTAPAAPTGTFPATAETGALTVAMGADDDVDSIDCGTGATVSGADGDFAGTFTIVKDDNAFSCIATDVCGLTSPALAVAITGREVTTLASPEIDPIVDVRLAVGATEADVVVTGTAEGATRVLATIDGENTSTLTVAADGTFALEAALDEGAHLLTFVATDDDEDTNDSVPVATDVDVLPALSAPSITCPSSPTNAASLALSGDKAIGTGIVVSVDGEDITVSVAEDATTNWSASVAVGGLADDTYAVSARSIVGTDVSVAETCAVVIDRTAPALAQLDPIVAIIDRGSSQGEVDFAGSGEIGAAVLAALDGGALTPVGTIGTDGRFAFSRTVNLAGNPHRIAVTLVDVAGNSSVREQAFTVVESLAAPTLRVPSATSFPLHTNLAAVALEGGKGSAAGIKLRPSDGGADVVLVAADASTSWTASLPVALNATTRFCLFAFTDTEESPLRCRSGSNPATAQPYEIIHDNVVPAAPVVVVDTTVQTPTVVATITKEADAAVLQERNGVVSTIDTGTAGTSVTPTLNVDLGTTSFCFTQRDKAGNVSDESCVDIRRSDARLDIATPETFAIVNGTSLAVAASMFDTTATSYRVCATTGTATPVCTDNIAAGAGGVLAATVPLGPAPAAATVTTIEVCGDDGEVSEPECATRQVVRIGAPEQVSTSATTTAKNDPQVAIDALGFVHLAWTDGSDVCSTGHSDVITTISRNASNRVTLRVSRPNELGLAVNGTFTVFGTTSFDGAYTVASITNGEVVTRTTLQNGAAETRGNILTDAVKLDCQATDILYTRFDDRGWSRPVNLSDVGGDAASTQPTIAVDGAGDVHVAWTEAGNLDPINGSARSPVSPADGGGRTDIVHVVIDGLTGAISRPLVVSRQDDSADAWVNDQAPAIAANGDDVVVAWESFVGTNRRVLVSRFNGTTWSTPFPALGTPTTTTPAPAVAVGPSGVAYVTWSEVGGRSLDNGTVGVSTDRDIVLCPLPRSATSCLLNTDVLVSTGSDTGTSADAAIAVAVVDGVEVVDVIWTDNESRPVNERRLRHRRLQLVGGETRSLGTPLTITNSGVAAAPVIVTGEGSHDPLIVYVDNSVTAAHPRFSFRSIAGTGVDTASVSFAAPALVFTGSEVTTSSTFTPAVAVTPERGAWFAVSQAAQTGVADSEIFVYATNY